MNLQLALKGEYFDEAKAGLKPEEYRLHNDYWKKRLVNRFYDRLILTRGYPKRDDESKRLNFKYRGYTVKEITHPHFGNKPVVVFAIHIEPGA